MSFPWYLQQGQISIYGVGFNTPTFARTTAQNDIVYGIVNQVWDGGGIGVSVGDKVYFRPTKVVCQLAYDTVPYSILKQEDIIITEIEELPP